MGNRMLIYIGDGFFRGLLSLKNLDCADGYQNAYLYQRWFLQRIVVFEEFRLNTDWYQKYICIDIMGKKITFLFVLAISMAFVSKEQVNLDQNFVADHSLRQKTSMSAVGNQWK